MKKFEDLKKRLLFSIIFVAAVGSLIFFSNIFLMGFAAAVAVGALSYFAVIEFIILMKHKNIHISKPVLFGGVLCEILACYIYSIYTELAILPGSVFLFFMIYLFLSNFRNHKGAIERIAATTFGFVYLALPLGLIFPILNIDSFGMQDGRYWIFYLIFVTKITDVVAYFGGRMFGKRKLADHLSPKKTIFGAVSGLLAAIAASIFFLKLVSQYVFHLNLMEAIVMGIILGVFAQIGDLSESLLKRDVEVKDTSSLPGLGGVLDMIDSLLFNIPILYIFLLG